MEAVKKGVGLGKKRMKMSENGHILASYVTDHSHGSVVFVHCK